MDEHASVFYCKDLKCYLMCYDSDLEKLPGPSRPRLSDGCMLSPYRLKKYMAGSLTPRYAMRVLYKPVKTTRGKAPDGTVDVCVVVNQDWLNMVAWQYEAAFPAGLPNDKLLNLTQCEVIDV